MTKQPIEAPDFGISLDGIPGVIILTLLAIGSFWAYFNGYVVAIKRLSLGEYSFLVVGILFVLGAIYRAYEYYQETKTKKKQ